MKTKYLSAILTSVTLSAMLAMTGISIGTAVAQPAPKADAVMTEELMARLIKRTLASKKDAWIAPKTCAIFGLAAC